MIVYVEIDEAWPVYTLRETKLSCRDEAIELTKEQYKQYRTAEAMWVAAQSNIRRKLSLTKVYVYPDQTVTTEKFDHMSDDYRVRYTDLCETCCNMLEPHYDEPIASCECGDQEWYD